MIGRSQQVPPNAKKILNDTVDGQESLALGGHWSSEEGHRGYSTPIPTERVFDVAQPSHNRFANDFRYSVVNNGQSVNPEGINLLGLSKLRR